MLKTISIYKQEETDPKRASHSLRHSFGSFLILNSADLYAVSKLLGHASIKITEQIYAELLQDTNVATTAILDKMKRSS